MGLIFGVGVGIVLLASMWIISLTICVFTSYSTGKIRYLGTILILLSTLLTIIFIVIPRKSKYPVPVDDSLIYEYKENHLVLLLVFCCISAFIGFVFYLVHHIMQPIYTMPMTKSNLS
ncbi:transmembrane protein 218 [Octopus bimaculoides]|uniref:Transmembrane protein 218 n=1 Tax=Octopus bimaculoides TaxID=37653 RepID=A0A0L8HY97_OCTBM|nr:transmembrane protein 218 [Octopus bimaculoides]|eukprot:XP_014768413.1 PREDICTED: transmembrane protein 218-like [Octopus bimaculoides]